VLAAEEFAMPAPDEARVTLEQSGKRRPLIAYLIALKLAVVTAGLVVWRVVRRKRSDG
jgi:hypothetical protein